MSLLETFGDAIVSLKTDAPAGEPKPSEIEIAHSLFSKLSDKYAEKEKQKENFPSIPSPPSSWITLAKQALAIALLAVILSLPFVQTQLQKLSEKPWVIYVILFVLNFIGAIVILKKI